MLLFKDGVGKSKENPIIISYIGYARERWHLLHIFLDYYKIVNDYDEWEREDVEPLIDGELSVFYFIRNKRKVDELWIDWTALFGAWER